MKPRHAETLVGADPVFTDGSVLTGLGPAFINVLLAVPPLETSGAVAPASRVQVVHTGATVLAGFLRACGYILLAVVSSGSNGTVTCIAIDSADTKGPDACAGVVMTLICVLGAVEASEAIWAVTGEVVAPENAAAVGARGFQAGVKQVVAVFAREPHRSFRAYTHIFTQMIETSGAIVAGR